MEKIHIKVNAAGNNAIQKLLDIALKAGGLQNIEGVANILNIIDIDDDFFKEIDKQINDPENGERAKESSKK